MERDDERRAAQARRDAWWTAKVVHLTQYREEKARLHQEAERLRQQPWWPQTSGARSSSHRHRTPS